MSKQRPPLEAGNVTPMHAGAEIHGDMPQGEAAICAVGKFLSDNHVTAEPRTMSWRYGGRGVTHKRLRMSLQLLYPWVQPALFEAALTERAELERDNQVREIAARVCGNGVVDARGHAELTRFVKLLAHPDTDAERMDYYVAAWRQLIWQVKRKLAGRPSSAEIMLILAGPQGTGKSTALAAFAAPLSFLCTPDADFRVFSDCFRKRLMQDSYLIVLDEMSKAKDTDIEEVKRCITAPVVQAREIHSSNEACYTRNASFVGATNGDAARLLHDETGMRRFVEMRFREGPANAQFRAELHDIDIPLLWRCVSHEQECPPSVKSSVDFSTFQREMTVESPLDAWFRECVLPTEDYTDVVTFNTMADSWKAWNQRFGGGQGMGRTTFFKTLRRKLPDFYRPGNVWVGRKIRLIAPEIDSTRC